MGDLLIVVMGGAIARFFDLKEVEFPELESGPNLMEIHNIGNPEKGLRGRELYTDLKAGRGRAPVGGPSHGYDDHRDQHHDESDRRFVKRISDEIRALFKKMNPKKMILVSPPKMLGFLREELEYTKMKGLAIVEVQKDMSKFSPLQIQSQLSKEGLIPARKRPKE